MQRRTDRLYHVYCAMKQRCYSDKNPSHKYYSKRNITVCQQWLEDYDAFKEWALENGYDYSKSRKEQSLDRIDNNKGYSPDNCRFISHSENCKNTIRNIWLEFNGEKKVLTDWSKETGIPVETLRNRVKRGLPAEEVLSSERFLHKSNTGIKGISFCNNKYYVYENRKYKGVRKTLNDAILLKEKSLHES